MLIVDGLVQRAGYLGRRTWTIDHESKLNLINVQKRVVPNGEFTLDPVESSMVRYKTDVVVSPLASEFDFNFNTKSASPERRREQA